MNLVQIFGKLPPKVAQDLEAELEASKVPVGSSIDEVLLAAKQSVFFVKQKHLHEGQLVMDLLDLLPEAIVKELQ